MELSDEYRTVGDLLDDFTERLLDEYGAEAGVQGQSGVCFRNNRQEHRNYRKEKAYKRSCGGKERDGTARSARSYEGVRYAYRRCGQAFRSLCDEGLKSAKSLTLDSDINEAADDLAETLGEQIRPYYAA